MPWLQNAKWRPSFSTAHLKQSYGVNWRGEGGSVWVGVRRGRRTEELCWRQWLGPNSSFISFSRAVCMCVSIFDTKYQTISRTIEPHVCFVQLSGFWRDHVWTQSTHRHMLNGSLASMVTKSSQWCWILLRIFKLALLSLWVGMQLYGGVLSKWRWKNCSVGVLPKELSVEFCGFSLCSQQ